MIGILIIKQVLMIFLEFVVEFIIKLQDIYLDFFDKGNPVKMDYHIDFQFVL